MTIAPKRKEVMQNFEISFSLGKATKMLSVDITSKNEVRGGGINPTMNVLERI